MKTEPYVIKLLYVEEKTIFNFININLSYIKQIYHVYYFLIYIFDSIFDFIFDSIFGSIIVSLLFIIL